VTPNADYGGRYRPRLLDLFCGAGGAAMGYAQAGFQVIGIDIDPQPSYPFEFHRDDALEFLTAPEWPVTFDVIHASPPCQRYANVTRWRGNPDDHPDVLDATLDALRARSIPWVVENVPEAIPNPDLILCGSMFGLSVQRHRHFLSSLPLFGLLPPCRHDDMFPFMHKGERSYADAMECAWMTNREAREAIPPAYTRWIAAKVVEALNLDVMPTRWTLCQYCGEAFACSRSDARYCTKKCRQNASNRKLRRSTLKALSVEARVSPNDSSGTSS
jgi:DNA (cytosine-5)-methyltransferase 1